MLFPEQDASIWSCDSVSYCEHTPEQNLQEISLYYDITFL